MLKKALKLELKEFDGALDGTFEGYGSTFGNVDRVGDIVERGAFAKSLQRHTDASTTPAMLFHHDMTRPVGKWLSIEEDTSGLYVKGKLSLGVRDADEAHQLLKDGVIESMSIGYIVDEEVYDHKSNVNYLKEISLHEISLVAIPANAMATVSSVKSEDGVLSIRELEVVLREAGLSRRESKAVLAAGFKAISPDSDILMDLAGEYVTAEVKTQLDRQIRIHALNQKLTRIT